MIAAASMALIGSVEARMKSKWAQRRVDHQIYALERAFGRNLEMLFDEDGRFMHERVHWARQHNRYAAGQTLSVDLGGGLVLDAATANAYFLGLVNGFNYDGLTSENEILTQDSKAELSNCFASTYALLGSAETAVWNI